MRPPPFSMPYTGPDDASLPTGVKRKPRAKRAQWVEVFNSVFKRSGDEGSAMRQAYGVTKALDAVLAGVKAKIYVNDPADAPTGVQVHDGPRGGQYWNTEELPAGATQSSRRPRKTAQPKRQLGAAYAGADDPNLPPRVKREAPEIRAAWVEAFNASVGQGQSEADALHAANQRLPKRGTPAAAKPRRRVGQAFAGPDDPGLPLRVRRDSQQNRQKWVSAFNQALHSGGSELMALQQANQAAGITKRKEAPDEAAVAAFGEARRQLEDALTELEVDPAEIEERVKELAAKCGMDMPLQVAVYRPFGGATSFDELDAYERGQEMRHEYDELSWQLRSLMNNVLDDEEMTPAEKATAISDLADEFATRAGDVPAEVDAMIEMHDEAAKGFNDRLRGLLPAFARKAAADPAVGGGVDRSKIPAADFAGRDRSFPIVTPKDVADAARSIGRAGPGNFSTDQLKANIIRIAKRKGPGFVARLPKAWQATKELDEEAGGSLTVFKDTAGAWRWLAVYSNNFYDREGEVFPEAAHKDYVTWVDRTKSFPDLLLWHVPGSQIGKADLVDYSEKLAVASGYFSPGMEDVAAALAADKEIAVSHGYEYRENDLGPDGAYRRYRTFEISPLPRRKAANLGTVFLPEEKEEIMSLTKEKRDFLVGKLGEERVKGIEDGLTRISKELTSSGIGWKEIAEAMSDTAPPAGAEPAKGPVPPAQAIAAGGDQPLDAAQATKALQDALKEVLGPLEARLKALEASDDEKVAARFGARVQPDPAKAASQSDASVINGNNALVKDAKKGLGDPDAPPDAAPGVPDFMKYYFSDGVMKLQVTAPAAS